VDKTLPKSLHTVTVLVNVARELIESGRAIGTSAAIRRASDVLGYSGATDPHDLLDKAMRQLGAERAAERAKAQP